MSEDNRSEQIIAVETHVSAISELTSPPFKRVYFLCQELLEQRRISSALHADLPDLIFGHPSHSTVSAATQSMDALLPNRPDSLSQQVPVHKACKVTSF